MPAMLPSRSILAAVVLPWLAVQPVEARATGAPALGQECSARSDHAGRRACWEELARSSADQLARAERQLLSRLEGWRQEPESRRRTRALLLASFERFASYRAAQCEAEASLAAGGNGAGDMRLSCVARLNRGRVAELRSVGSGLG